MLLPPIIDLLGVGLPVISRIDVGRFLRRTMLARQTAAITRFAASVRSFLSVFGSVLSVVTDTSMVGSGDDPSVGTFCGA